MTSIDGSAMSASTETAVRWFQRDRHLQVDGLVGPDTWEQLVEAGWQLGDPTQAEDATHDVFLKAYRKFHDFRGESGLQSVHGPPFGLGCNARRLSEQLRFDIFPRRPQGT